MSGFFAFRVAEFLLRLALCAGGALANCLFSANNGSFRVHSSLGPIMTPEAILSLELISLHLLACISIRIVG